jgi:imidazolonepropionase
VSGRRLVLAKRLVTCDPRRATHADPLGVLEDGALLIEGGRIAAIGTAAELTPAELVLGGDSVHRAELVTPGLVDAHTHAAWVGSRHAEYALRMQGADYEAIAAAGGGILSSMRAVREARVDQLERALAARLGRMASLGVTTIEVKSGYGLDTEGERKQLEAIRAVTRRPGTPRVSATFLALHALPPEACGDRDAYAREALARVEDFATADLFDWVDAYVDRSAFSVAQARPVLAAARRLGRGARLHAGQFADVGGAELAAEVGAASADHLENVSEAGAEALAAAGTRAVLLPIASFTLGQAPPPVALLRRAGVGLVVASDANPGTAPSESLPLAMALAVRSYGLTVAEAILGATREAALSLGLADTGVLRPEASADLVLWDLPHEAALVQPWGTARADRVFSRGVELARG